MNLGPVERPLKILYASAEISPFSKVGGLADVAASLPKALAELGHDVRVITPDHGGRAEKTSAQLALSTTISFLGREEPVELVHALASPDVPLYFVRNHRYFHHTQVYGAPDDLLRYHLFSQVVLESPKLLDWRPDILHCNDWHTALLPFGLRNRAWSDSWYRPMASVLTIHNLGYRGPDNLTDVLSQGIYYADVINTVSRTYAQEITTPELGEGLHTLLRLRQDRLFGIVNGLDITVYDPRSDPDLVEGFDAAHLLGKSKNKEALQARLGLPVTTAIPLAGMVTRLVEQKGVDLLVGALEKAVQELGMQFAILGTGDPALQNQLQDIASRYPASVRLVLAFEPKLGQLIYGGSDLFLMPSRYEPCGLGQLIAMRYGTVPVVRKTGGLADTVVDVAPDLSAGTGFVFEPYQQQALYEALRRATVAFQDRGTWEKLQRRCMTQDFSWTASAREYSAMYYRALKARG